MKNTTSIGRVSKGIENLGLATKDNKNTQYKARFIYKHQLICNLLLNVNWLKNFRLKVFEYDITVGQQFQIKECFQDRPIYIIVNKVNDVIQSFFLFFFKLIDSIIREGGYNG